MATNIAYRAAGDLPPIIPVFPLAGALLLPRVEMPLNIFEPRYLAMIDDAMKGARVIGPNGKTFTQDGIGMALGMRELNRHLREVTGGQTYHSGFSKQDRSRFLNELENCIAALKRAG